MGIEDRNLAAGTRLTADYKGRAWTCSVAEDEGGKLAYVLEDGRRFTSPSAAGSAVMGGIACNGWRFWSVKDEEPASPAPDAANTPAPTAKPGNQARSFKLIKRTPNQQGVPEGSTRWFCSACMKGFLAEGDQTPEVCPEGHRADDPELTATP